MDLHQAHKLDPGDYMLPFCPKCVDHIMLLVRFRRRDTGAYVNMYHCQECKYVGDKANWQKP